MQAGNKDMGGLGEWLQVAPVSYAAGAMVANPFVAVCTVWATGWPVGRGHVCVYTSWLGGDGLDAGGVHNRWPVADEARNLGSSIGRAFTE